RGGTSFGGGGGGGGEGGGGGGGFWFGRGAAPGAPATLAKTHLRFRCCLRDFRKLSRSRRGARTPCESASPGFATRTTQVADRKHSTLPRSSAHWAGPGFATSGVQGRRTMEGSSNQKTLRLFGGYGLP